MYEWIDNFQLKRSKGQRNRTLKTSTAISVVKIVVATNKLQTSSPEGALRTDGRISCRHSAPVFFPVEFMTILSSSCHNLKIGLNNCYKDRDRRLYSDS